MSSSSEEWSTGTLRGKQERLSKSLRTTENQILQPKRFLTKVEGANPNDVVEKDFQGEGEQPGLGSILGLGRFIDKNSPKPKPENFPDSPSAAKETVTKTVAEGQPLEKEMVEKILKEAGWDKFPMTDKARAVVEDAVGNGAKPVTEYTGKLMIERGRAEEPPAFVKPKSLKVGDRVVVLHWQPVGTFGAKFDLPYTPEAARVGKMHTGMVNVTKNAYPYGRVPKDLSKCETMPEERMWGLELESEGVKKEDDGMAPSPTGTKDSTMVLRLEPLASPQGEVVS